MLMLDGHNPPTYAAGGNDSNHREERMIERETLAPSQLTDAVVHDIRALYTQLSKSEKLVPIEYIRNTCEHSMLLVGKDGPRIICMATLTRRHILSGHVGYIDGLVVDADCRRHGLARELMDRILSMASNEGLVRVQLTSKPEREAANALYTACGGEKTATNKYRFAVPKNL
ncbi:GNAT family N-acetyltransferase [Candidatus Kaiserbacteria bacterium]|nr:GNAT family N-acetyltransferase [Candidatus Kaiserbacteria bacterium]